jgi:hypothetical protein
MQHPALIGSVTCSSMTFEKPRTMLTLGLPVSATGQ